MEDCLFGGRVVNSLVPDGVRKCKRRGKSLEYLHVTRSEESR